jgi:hypothetical protein
MEYQPTLFDAQAARDEALARVAANALLPRRPRSTPARWVQARKQSGTRIA